MTRIRKTRKNTMAVSTVRAVRFFVTAAALALVLFSLPLTVTFASAGAGTVIDASGSDSSAASSSSSSQAAGTSRADSSGSKSGQSNAQTASNASGTTNTSNATTSATNTTTTKDTLEQLKKEAKKDIKGYGDIKKLKVDDAKAKEIDKVVKKYTDLIGTAEGNKNIKGLSTEGSLDDCVSAAKEAIDALISTSEDDTEKSSDNNLPSSTSDFIMVGGNWVTPHAVYGQVVNVVLPVVNMSQVNLTNVTVTPVISNSVQEWPFELLTSGYTQTIPDLPGKGNGQDDMDRRRELTWTFQTRADALSGYYKLQFNVLYGNGSEVESAVLTTYVKVTGAPGSGSAEGEGGGISTPRVIVTGFDTEPAKVHAGDTFILTLHLKNTSKRTTVSNMLVNLTAPNEGSDTDSSYAAFLPTSGSNTEYISSIGRGAVADLVIEMTAKADLSQKPYQLDVTMDYEDEDYTSFSATADVSIPVYQEARFEISEPELVPAQIAVGSDANVMFSIYNLGKVTLYNVKVGFDGETVSAPESFIGKVEAGGTGNVDVMVNGEKATSDKDKSYIVVTYEDEAGNQSEYRQELRLEVTGAEESPESLTDYEFEDEDGYETVEYKEGGVKKIVIIAVVALLAIAAIVVIVLLIRAAGNKKRRQEDLSLLKELEEGKGKDEDP